MALFVSHLNKHWVCPPFSPEKALFQCFFTFLTTFPSFIFHLYLIHLMFYSHPSQRLEFILFAVLSTHFLLHQYFNSSFPLFFYLLFTSFLFFLSCFCTVTNIYNHRDLLRISLKVSLPFFISCSLSLLLSPTSFIWSLLCFTWAPLLRVAPKVSSADELKLFVVGGAEFFLLLLLRLMGLRSYSTPWSRGVHQHL